MTAKAEERGFGKAAVTLPHQGLGHLAPALLGHADPGDPLREVRRRARAGGDLPVVLPLDVEITGKGRSPLENVPEFVNVNVSEVRRRGAARDRHDGHVRRFVLVLLPLLRRAQRPGCRSIPQKIAYWFPDRPVHRRRRARHPAPDLLALLHEGDARPRPDHERRAGAAPVHAGHGDQRRREDVEVQGQRRQRRT